MAGAAILMLLAAPTARADDSTGLGDLVDAAAQRLQTADPIAASKWLSGAPISDPARIRQVLTDVRTTAESVGLPAEYVEAVFSDQIDATEAVQYGRFSAWKLDPPAAPASAPDLSASRTLIDDLNRRMVGEMAEDWPVLTGPTCGPALEAAKGEVALRRGLDPLYRDALDAATRSYCR